MGCASSAAQGEAKRSQSDILRKKTADWKVNASISSSRGQDWSTKHTTDWKVAASSGGGGSFWGTSASSASGAEWSPRSTTDWRGAASAASGRDWNKEKSASWNDLNSQTTTDPGSSCRMVSIPSAHSHEKLELVDEQQSEPNRHRSMVGGQDEQLKRVSSLKAEVGDLDYQSNHPGSMKTALDGEYCQPNHPSRFHEERVVSSILL